MEPQSRFVSLKELTTVFFKLGILGFGGPAAHIAMMRKEVVEKKKWMSEKDFLDLVGATHLIPGPNSTELAIHIGREKSGLLGLMVAGASFILPAFFCVLVLSLFYVEMGNLPIFEPILMGIRPVILAIIVDALLKFSSSAIPDSTTRILAALGLIGVYMGLSEVWLIFGVGFIYSLTFKVGFRSLFVLPFFPNASVPLAITNSSIFYYFLKIGSVLFGSGYVLVAFLRTELVETRMWLSEKQLLDAITVGQITPGPVFTTATFIGYLLKGYVGAVLATLGIFLPSFVFVVITAPFLKSMQSSPFFRRFLNAVNAVSFALLTKTSLDFVQTIFVNFSSVFIGLCSFFILFRFPRFNSAWLLFVSGILGWLFY